MAVRTEVISEVNLIGLFKGGPGLASGTLQKLQNERKRKKLNML